MATARFRTDKRHWLIAAGGLFIALGFVDPVAGVAKGDNSLWHAVVRLVTGHYFCSTGEITTIVLMRSALQAVPAVVLGWVAQAILVVARGRAVAPDADPEA